MNTEVSKLVQTFASLLGLAEQGELSYAAIADGLSSIKSVDYEPESREEARELLEQSGSRSEK